MIRAELSSCNRDPMALKTIWAFIGKNEPTHVLDQLNLLYSHLHYTIIIIVAKATIQLLIHLWVIVRCSEMVNSYISPSISVYSTRFPELKALQNTPWHCPSDKEGPDKCPDNRVALRLWKYSSVVNGQYQKVAWELIPHSFDQFKVYDSH